MENENDIQESQDLDGDSQDTETTDTQLDANALAEKNKQLFARAKKAEEEAKKLREELKAKSEAKTETNKINTPSATTISREEAILFAKGYTEEEVDLANKLSALNGVSLLKATEDEFFQAKVEKRKQGELSKKASLGASTGGGSFQTTKPIEKMSREEHEEYMRKVMAE